VIERLEALGCDPIEGMARIALDPGTPLDLRARMFAELAPYVYPKRKALEATLASAQEAVVVNFSFTRKKRSPNAEPGAAGSE
jgi:hypothetical protein